MKNTNTFRLIVTNTKVALVLVAALIVATFVLAVLHIAPGPALDLESITFLGWVFASLIALVAFGRNVRLILLALA
jgi:hypothetical protein